jgi:hypothetical protein
MGICPNVAPSLLDFLCTRVLDLRPDEGPDFVALETANAETANVSMVIAGRGAAKAFQGV